MRIYISGKISGLPEYEVRQKFADAERYISTVCHHHAANPLNKSLDWNAPRWQHMKEDIELLLSCDAILMLPDYKDSEGALLEHSIAEQCWMNIYYTKEEIPIVQRRRSFRH